MPLNYVSILWRKKHLLMKEIVNWSLSKARPRVGFTIERNEPLLNFSFEKHEEGSPSSKDEYVPNWVQEAKNNDKFQKRRTVVHFSRL